MRIIYVVIFFLYFLRFGWQLSFFIASSIYQKGRESTSIQVVCELFIVLILVRVAKIEWPEVFLFVSKKVKANFLFLLILINKRKNVNFKENWYNFYIHHR